MQQHYSSYIFSVLLVVLLRLNRVSRNLRVPAALRVSHGDPGVRVHFFYFWLSVNSLSSPVNGYFEGRWPTSNVGVHSYMSIKASSNFERTSSVIRGSVAVQVFSHANMMIARWLAISYFGIPWLGSFFLLDLSCLIGPTKYFWNLFNK